MGVTDFLLGKKIEDKNIVWYYKCNQKHQVI